LDIPMAKWMSAVFSSEPIPQAPVNSKSRALKIGLITGGILGIALGAFIMKFIA